MGDTSPAMVEGGRFEPDHPEWVRSAPRRLPAGSLRL